MHKAIALLGILIAMGASIHFDNNRVLLAGGFYLVCHCLIEIMEKD